MINAKQEVLGLVERSNSKVRCAIVTTDSLNYNWEVNGSYGWKEGEGKDKNIKLRVGYNEEDCQKFLSDLDFEYDNGYGLQVVYGTVWFEDGTWAERHDYDGSEWWVLRELPAIPNDLVEINK